MRGLEPVQEKPQEQACFSPFAGRLPRSRGRWRWRSPEAIGQYSPMCLRPKRLRRRHLTHRTFANRHWTTSFPAQGTSGGFQYSPNETRRPGRRCSDRRGAAEPTPRPGRSVTPHWDTTSESNRAPVVCQPRQPGLAAVARREKNGEEVAAPRGFEAPRASTQVQKLLTLRDL